MHVPTWKRIREVNKDLFEVRKQIQVAQSRLANGEPVGRSLVRLSQRVTELERKRRDLNRELVAVGSCSGGYE